jgi:hypothetical protein
MKISLQTRRSPKPSALGLGNGNLPHAAYLGQECTDSADLRSAACCVAGICTSDGMFILSVFAHLLSFPVARVLERLACEGWCISTVPHLRSIGALSGHYGRCSIVSACARRSLRPHVRGAVCRSGFSRGARTAKAQHRRQKRVAHR